MRGGDYLSLPYHGVSRPDPTAMLTQNWCEASGCGNGVGQTPRPRVFWSSLVAPWRTVWQCKVEQNTAHLFRNKFPVNYRSSSKNHFKFPGNFKPILGNESVVSLWRKRHLFSKRSKRWHGFPPSGCLCCQRELKLPKFKIPPSGGFSARIIVQADKTDQAEIRAQMKFKVYIYIYIYLVGGLNPSENICQLGLFFPIYGKIKHVPSKPPTIYIYI